MNTYNSSSSGWGVPDADQAKAIGAAKIWCCNGTLSDIPEHFMFDGCLANLEKWVRTSTLPPKADLIQVENGKIVRDEFGNAKGGLRSPYVDVPVKTYSPASIPCPSCEPAALCALFSNWCFLEGSVVPFDVAKLQQLYSDHNGYVAKFNASADKMFQGGFVTQADLAEMKTEAAASDVLK